MNKFIVYQIVAFTCCLVLPLWSNAEPEMMGIGQDLLSIESEKIQSGKKDSMIESSEQGINAEVLVFVDVSGSMKKNDPLNMRSPAIRLLAGMAPQSANVGIYLFGTTVRELVPFNSVSEHWKLLAENRSEQYQSRDMYTNIEAALVSAESRWSQNTNRQRSIILLTDGIVDIDKNSLVSIESRDRILDNVIASLQEQRVNVHTIALSDNADHRLLKQLAVSTEGHYQQVDRADLLQRTFMNLFEQSAPQDTVPLKGNQITIDNSISELTLLVFHKEGANPTQLKSPQGTVYKQTSKQEELKWKHDRGYDLISINNPIAGTWQLIADEDPDNRAMIVTDLKLQTGNLPGVLLSGEEITLDMWVEDKGKRIERESFLKLIKSSLLVTDPSGEGFIKSLNKPDTNGVISHTLGPDWQIGEQELLVKIESDTFSREKRFPVTVYASPFEVLLEEVTETVKTEQTENESNDPINTLGWNVKVMIVPELIDMEQSSISLEIVDQKNTQQQVEVLTSEQGWQFQYNPVEPGQSLVNIQLKTVSPSGREIVIQHPEIKLGELVEIKPQAEPQQETQKEPVEEITLPTLQQIIIPVVVGNILFLILFLGWRILKRMREASNLPPEEVL